MFLHIGKGYLIPIKEVIAILNIRTLGKINFGEINKFVGKPKQLKEISRKKKSLIITDKTIYVSPISSITLKSRGEVFKKKDERSSLLRENK